MKMTYAECLQMLDGLSAMDQVSASILHVDVSLAVANNKRRLNDLINDQKSLIKWSTEYQIFQNERKELLKKHAEKDKDGRPIKQTIDSPRGLVEDFMIKGGTEEGSPYDKDFQNLKTKYKNVIEEQEAKAKKYNESLDVEIDFEPRTVSSKLLPEKGIPQAAMNGLIYMLTEENQRKKTKK